MTGYAIIRNWFLLCVLVLTPSTILSGQEASIRVLDAKGIGSGTYIGIPLYLLPEGNYYSPKVFNGYYHLPLTKKEKDFSFSLDFIPHGAAVATGNQYNLEFGLNLFLDFSVGFGHDTAAGIIIGSGPHYFSLQTDRQIKGFIFSDHLLVSLKKRLVIHGEPMIINYFAGLRHISNGSLKQPNRGINNVVMGLQVSKQFGGKFLSF